MILVKTPGKSYVRPRPCKPDYEKVMKQMRLTWKLWKNDFVIIPKGYEEAARQLNRSYKIRTVD